MNRILHKENLSYISVVIQMRLINKHHNNQLTGYFGIKKNRELIAQKYDWPVLRANIKSYIK